MSYPEALYLGSAGESTAIRRPASHAPDLYREKTGLRVHYLATGAGKPEAERAAFFIKHDTYWT